MNLNDAEFEYLLRMLKNKREVLTIFIVKNPEDKELVEEKELVDNIIKGLVNDRLRKT